MQQQTVLSDNDFPKYSRAHVAMSIMVAWRFLKCLIFCDILFLNVKMYYD